MWTTIGTVLLFVFMYNLYQQGISKTGRAWPWIMIMCVVFLIVIELESINAYPIYALVIAELVALGALRLFARN